jgi:glycine/D-amino acid oxidase-like deaminating enzyme
VTAGVPSWWLEQLGAPRDSRPPLDGSIETDVCIVGAGFTGLWTAYELRRADPSLDVVVLEKEFAGFGASGRNGGWVIGELSGSRHRLAARAGLEGVHALARAIHETVDEVARVVAAEGIECAFRKDGSLHVAQSDVELRRLRAEVEEDRRFGLTEHDSALLGRDELARRIRVVNGVGARFTPHCARVQPAALARGLGLAAERSGARIFEQTAVKSIEPRRARTGVGDVRARWIVRATEGYTADLPGSKRLLVPVSSAMIATEPLGDDAWRSIGWDHAETLLDGRHLYAYAQRTADGRIAIGGRGVPYRYGSGTAREDRLSEATVSELRARLRRLFGDAADVPVAASWHGVLGVSRDWAPSVGADPETGLAWAGGYAGEGVAAANLAGRTLRDLILGHESELTRLAWIRAPARRWEPEPLRFAGIHSVYALLRAADSREERTGRPSRLAALADRIAGR